MMSIGVYFLSPSPPFNQDGRMPVTLALQRQYFSNSDRVSIVRYRALSLFRDIIRTESGGVEGKLWVTCSLCLPLIFLSLTSQPNITILFFFLFVFIPTHAMLAPFSSLTQHHHHGHHHHFFGWFIYLTKGEERGNGTHPPTQLEGKGQCETWRERHEREPTGKYNITSNV